MKWVETRVPGPRELSGLTVHSAEGERAALEPEVASQGADPMGSGGQNSGACVQFPWQPVSCGDGLLGVGAKTTMSVGVLAGLGPVWMCFDWQSSGGDMSVTSLSPP